MFILQRLDKQKHCNQDHKTERLLYNIAHSTFSLQCFSTFILVNTEKSLITRYNINSQNFTMNEIFWITIEKKKLVFCGTWVYFTHTFFDMLFTKYIPKVYQCHDPETVLKSLFVSPLSMLTVDTIFKVIGLSTNFS